MKDEQSTPEPMPIWFFVGLILSVYGVLVIGAGALMETPERVTRVTSMEPGIWWGAIMLAGGIAFLAASLTGRRR